MKLPGFPCISYFHQHIHQAMRAFIFGLLISSRDTRIFFQTILIVKIDHLQAGTFFLNNMFLVDAQDIVIIKFTNFSLTLQDSQIFSSL